MSIKKINKTHYCPELAPGPGDGKSFPLSRSSFLDGDIKCYYGPGQPPDSGNTLVGYNPPTRWPEAGALLFVPQIVWLSTYMHDLDYRDPTRLFELGFTVTSYLTYRRPTPKGGWAADWSYGVDEADGFTIATATGLSDQAGNYGIRYLRSGNPLPVIENTIPAGPSTIPDDYIDPGAYVEHLDNPYPAEYDRLLTLFTAVKTRIESLRPNRTYVEVLNWFDLNNREQPAKYYLPLLDPDNEDDYYIHLVAPQDHDKYFGINFLHIFAGDPTSVVGNLDEGSDEFNIDVLSDWIFNKSYTDIEYVMDSGSLKSKRFANYALRVFALPSLDEGTGPIPPLHATLPTEIYRMSPKPIKTLEGVYYTHDPDFPIDIFNEHQIRHVYTIDPWYPLGMIAGKVAAPPAPTLDDPPSYFWDYSSGITGYVLRGQTSFDNIYITDSNSLNQANENINFTANVRINVLKNQMSYLADQGVDAQFGGFTGDITDADILVRYIADHFQFDPETGKDN